MDRRGAECLASLRIVEFEHAAGLFEVEESSIDDELPFACVGGYLMDSLDGVALGSKLLDDKVDVDHAG